MIVVADASAAIKLVLTEPGSDVVRRLWDEPLHWVAPTVAVAEVSAGIGGAHRAGRLRATAARRAQAGWLQLVEEIDLLTVDPALAAEAAALAVTHPLRGMDAVYLASARRLAGGAVPVALLSFDRRQRAAVDAGDAGDGLAVLPAGLS